VRPDGARSSQRHVPLVRAPQANPRQGARSPPLDQASPRQSATIHHRPTTVSRLQQRTNGRRCSASIAAASHWLSRFVCSAQVIGSLRATSPARAKMQASPCERVACRHSPFARLSILSARGWRLRRRSLRSASRRGDSGARQPPEVQTPFCGAACILSMRDAHLLRADSASSAGDAC
jgi:hypothetical protein